jgi:hypothetical protein
MAKEAYPTGTTYRVVFRNQSCCVEVTLPGASPSPYLLIGFKTDAEAEAWIKEQQEETETG